MLATTLRMVEMNSKLSDCACLRLSIAMSFLHETVMLGVSFLHKMVMLGVVVY